MEEKRYFTGVMNVSDEDRVLPPGDYRKIMNGYNGSIVENGAVQNVLGALLINNPFLSSGENRVIGYRQNIPDNSIIYWVYNEFGDHGVYMWRESEPPYTDGVIEKIWKVQGNKYAITENPLGFSKDFLITGSSLVEQSLTFTDYNKRGKIINIERANNTKKRLRFKLIFNKNTLNQTTDYQLELFDTNYNTVGVLQTLNWSSSATTLEGRAKDFKAAYSIFGSNNFLVTGCTEFAILEMYNIGEYQFHVTEKVAGVSVATPAIIVADNFYPDIINAPNPFKPLSVWLFDRLKYTAYLPPTSAYLTDPSRQINLVKNRVFQFRIKYIYFDNTESVYSSISKIPLQSQTCDDNNNYGYRDNYILVDFTDPRLQEAEFSSIIQSVELAVLEPAVSTIWRTVKVFEQHEVVGIGQQNYKFYNDGNYPAISDFSSLKPFDSLPIIWKSEEFADDRPFLGGTVEGYDKPCADVDINVTYEQKEANNFFVVKGKIRIVNPHFFESDQAYSRVGAIFGVHETPADPTTPLHYYFGSIRDVKEPDHTRPSDFRQEIPLAGYTVFSAGTSYATVSRQLYTGKINQDPTTGAYMPTVGNQTNIAIDFNLLDQSNQLYSEFSLFLPKGYHSIRIASHLTTQDEVNSGGKEYQKTSTYMLGVENNGTRTVCKEIIINVTGNVDLGYIETATFTDMDGAATGYVTDPNPIQFAPEPPPASQIKTIRVTQAELLIDDSPGIVDEVTNQYWTGVYFNFYGALWNDKKVFSDHNGYFFIPTEEDFSDITQIISGANDLNFDVTAIDGSPFVPCNSGTNKCSLGCYKNTNTDVTDFSRTRITGNVTDINGASLSVIPVIDVSQGYFGGGDIGYTDINGNYIIFAYVDTVSIYYGTGSSNRQMAIMFQTDGASCLSSFSSQITPYNISIGVSSYNDVNWYTINQVVSLVPYEVSSSALKRGGDYQLALCYLDDGDRRCGVVTDDRFKLHINFYTERLDVGLYPFTGKPIVDWAIYHTPPAYATKYQWLITKNLQLSNALTWAANTVQYVDEAFAPDPQGVFCKINLDNIGYYVSNIHPDSTITFTFSKGDRLRLKMDENNVYYQTYYDFEIIKQDGNDIYIYRDNRITLRSGVVFETYTPKGENIVNLYYEWGECYPVKEAFFGGILKKYHAGSTQDQSYGLSPGNVVTPATGTFNSGSTYYRLREIPYNTPAAGTGAVVKRFVPVDDSSISDFYLSKADGTGKIHVDDPSIAQVNRPTAVRFGNRYIQNTRQNGLCSFEALNDKQLSTIYGLIEKLMLVNNTVLVAVCHNSYMVSMYIHQNVLRSATGQQVVLFSDDVINNVNQMQRSFGTQDPASIELNDEGDMLGWDESQAVVWRYSGNGLLAVSEYKMTPEFNRIADARRALNPVRSNTVAIYDLAKDLYIISFNPKRKQRPERAKAIVSIQNLDISEIPSDVNLFIKINPTNTVLFVGQMTDFPTVSESIYSGINLSTATTGFYAVWNNNGGVTVYSPPGYIYSHLNINIVFTWTDESGVLQTKSYPFNFDVVPVTANPLAEDYIGDTLAFCKEKKGWTEYYPFNPEMYGRIKNTYVSFVDGNLYIHERGNIGEYYGVKYPLQIKTVFNAEYAKVNKYMELNVNSNSKEIYCPTITTPPRQNAPAGMVTELTKAHFKMVLGKYWAKLTRDKNTPNMPLQKAWINGRVMEGQSMEVTLENDDVVPVKIMDIGTIYINSEKS